MWTTQTLSESRSKHVLKSSVDALNQLAAFKAVVPISKKNSAYSTKSAVLELRSCCGSWMKYESPSMPKK